MEVGERVQSASVRGERKGERERERLRGEGVGQTTLLLGGERAAITEAPISTSFWTWGSRSGQVEILEMSSGIYCRLIINQLMQP